MPRGLPRGYLLFGILWNIFWDYFKGSDLRIKMISNNRSISEQVALEKLADAVWTTDLSHIHVDKNASGNYVLTVTVSYGTKFATSGSVDGERIIRTDLLAKGALKMFRAGHKRKLTKLIMELSTGVATEKGGSYSMIAYRAALSLEQVKSIPYWENCDRDYDVVRRISNVWTVELDEFNNMRIENR